MSESLPYPNNQFTDAEKQFAQDLHIRELASRAASVEHQDMTPASQPIELLDQDGNTRELALNTPLDSTKTAYIHREHPFLVKADDGSKRASSIQDVLSEGSTIKLPPQNNEMNTSKYSIRRLESPIDERGAYELTEMTLTPSAGKRHARVESKKVQLSVDEANMFIADLLDPANKEKWSVPPSTVAAAEIEPQMDIASDAHDSQEELVDHSADSSTEILPDEGSAAEELDPLGITHNQDLTEENDKEPSFAEEHGFPEGTVPGIVGPDKTDEPDGPSLRYLMPPKPENSTDEQEPKQHRSRRPGSTIVNLAGRAVPESAAAKISTARQRSAEAIRNKRRAMRATPQRTLAGRLALGVVNGFASYGAANNPGQEQPTYKFKYTPKDRTHSRKNRASTIGATARPTLR